MTPADQRATAPSSQQLSPAARWEGARDEDSSLERAGIEKVQGECVRDHVRAVLLEAVERVACKGGDGPGDLAESQASPSPAAAGLPARASPLASDSETTVKDDRPPQAQSEATVKPARRGSRRGSATLAQREAAARAALAAALNRTGMDRKTQSKEWIERHSVYGTVFGTCQVGQVACTAIQVTTRNRLALVEQCSDAVLGDLARRNSGWSAELGSGSQQIFLLAEGEAKSTAVFSRHGDSQALVIHLFGTAAPCQQQGYGTALLRMLQKFTGGADIFVEVATDKLPAWWLSKAFLGSFTKFSKPRLWPKTTALLRWNADTDVICSVCKRGQTVHFCPFRSCSYESRRASDLQHHIQSKHAEQSPRHSGHQLWQEPASFKGELGAPSSREQGAERNSPALGRTLHHQRPTQVLAAEESSVKRPRATTRKLSGDDVRKRSDRQGKHDNQEQKWVRKIVALARQTDKSDLPAKAKTLFRMMKADLRSSTRSESEEDTDGDSSESNDNHICADCGREFSSSNGLGQHRRHW